MDYKKFFHNHVFKDVNIDKKLADRIHDYRVEFENRDEHREFLNSPYLGLHLLRFTSNDEIVFYNILGIDYREYVKDLKKLRCIDHSRKTESNPFYNILVALMAEYYNSKLNSKVVEQVVNDLYHIFIYKAAGSYMSVRFSEYLATKENAVETYERLSNNFLLKQFGSWKKVIDYKSEIVTLKHKYGKMIKSYKCRDVVYVIAALKTMINSRLGEVYTVYLQVIDDGNASAALKAIKDHQDGKQEILEHDYNPRRYINNVKRVIGKDDFINRDVLKIIETMFTNVTANDLEYIIKYFNNYYHIDSKLVEKIIEDSIIASLQYIHENNIKADYKKHIVNITMLVRNYFSSGKVNNKLVKETKNNLYIIIRAGLNIKTGWKLTPLAIAIVVYIVIISFIYD